MRTLSLIITAILFFTVGSFCLKAIHPPALNPSTRIEPTEAFLGLDCGLSGLEEELIEALRKQGKAAERYFVSLIKEGLPAEVIEAAQSDYARFFEYRHGFLTQKERRITVRQAGRDEAKAWIAPKVDADNYVRTRMKKLERNTQARAMEGLAILETASGKDYLQQLAKDDRFELQAYAQELLDR